MQKVVTIEIGLPYLVSEADAELQRPAEILFAQAANFQLAGRAYGRVAWLVGEERHFPKYVADSESRDQRFRFAVG